jgi:hypothetical protein
MNAHFRDAIERLRRPDERAWYLERHARLHGLKERVTGAVNGTGLSARVHVSAAAPALTVRFAPLKRQWGSVAAQYGLTVTASALCDVYFVEHTVEAPNVLGSGGVDHSLYWASASPAIEPLAAAATILEGLGFRAASREEAAERCPGLTFRPGTMFRGSVDAFWALTADLNGWFDDPPQAPRPWIEIAPELVPLRAAAASACSSDAPQRAAARPAWLAVAEEVIASVPAVRSLESLAPAAYPASGWTLDFGEVSAQGMRARFRTDLFVSRLVPFWYFTTRFAVPHAEPDRLVTELHQWSTGELG